MATSTTPLKYLSKLQNRRILIIGGTSGIGFSTAEAALEHGANVIISSSRPPKLAHALSRLRASYPSLTAQITGHTCDLSSPQELETRIPELLARAAGDGKIDHIAFTAGDAIQVKHIEDATVEYIQKTGNVRFFGALMLAKFAPRYLAPGPGSSITLTGGTMAQKPRRNWAVMCAWGSGMEGMARGLAVDLAPIRVNLVSPGAVHTELYDDIPKEALEGVLKGYRDESLVGRVGRPEDLAEAYLYLMKDEFATGTVVQNDGGRLIKP
ncbi:MAG: hypothetical protein LQ343_004843 [Gyalolechia ehrenbergii]|nr:MAG: hypothetical protein LQ343_004843 [Gyalolechia ehrenbergii]